MKNNTWPSELPDPEALGFGRYLAPYIVEARHDANGWQAARTEAREHGHLPIATGAVQYGISVFEGLKAFRGRDGAIHLFRPQAHARRFEQSAERLAMPALPQGWFERLCERAVMANQHYLPPHGRGSLYLRPTLFASEEQLGLRAASEHRLTIIAMPCSEPQGSEKRLWIEHEYSRAAAGGLGAVKTGANYAASVYATRAAQARGFDDVLWCDAATHEQIGEAGTMNVFVALRDRVLTPALDGSILAGITRDSLITLLRRQGMPTEERVITIEELRQWQETGELREIFGCGTAARIVPISELGSERGTIRPAGGKLAQELSMRLAQTQNGRLPDFDGWLWRCNSELEDAGVALSMPRAAEAA